MLKREEIWGNLIGVLILILWGWGNYVGSQYASQNFGKVDRPNYEQSRAEHYQPEPRFAVRAATEGQQGGANDQAKADEGKGGYHVDVGVTAATLLLCALVFWQVLMFNKQLGKMDSDTQLSLERAKAVTLSERAYIHLSHKPPGLDIRASEGRAAITVEVKNSGKTPAHVTDVVLKCAVGKLPAATDPIIPRPDHRVTRAFLVTGGKIFHSNTFTKDQDIWNAVKEEAVPCWIFGYVDYVDIFKVRRRGGYMRKFDRWDNSRPEPIPGVPAERANNLIFDAAPGFNYDRVREPGEGNDWDEKY